MSLRKEGYKSRIIDKVIENKLNTFGAVCIEGPKWCGKTWASLNHSNSVVFLGDPTNNYQNKRLAETSTHLVLNGDMPRLIDEWQEVPEIWDAVRHKVDESIGVGKFILTGSSTPTHKGILHSGTGRIARIRMRPMTLYESGDSSGTVSLNDLFENKEFAFLTSDVSLEKIIDIIVRGGWPNSINKSRKQTLDITKEYINSIIEEDFTRVDGIKRNKVKVAYLLRSLARNESTMASNSTLRKDITENEDDSVDIDTIADYLDVFERLFLIDNQPAFNPNFRSSIRVARSPKRHLVDPSLAIAALDLSHEKLLDDLDTLGLMFESLVVRDLRIYGETNGGKIYHYRNFNTNKELDAVIEYPDGRWGGFEIKLGFNKVDEAAKNLIDIANYMESQDKSKKPAFLCVICGLTTAAYKREDGVYVIPITALKH
ncbi:DUF4143 domain-containing protein [Acholeplasma sp. OttesenSCG-928-E16]|nr:DUF4143 domain-containing protein [Acholeplasma sp. OttesenSCG-928-E16]